MREWIEDLSDWMERKEKISVDPAVSLLDEWEQTSQEIDSLLQVADQLPLIYTRLRGKLEHDNS